MDYDRSINAIYLAEKKDYLDLNIVKKQMEFPHALDLALVESFIYGDRLAIILKKNYLKSICLFSARGTAKIEQITDEKIYKVPQALLPGQLNKLNGGLYHFKYIDNVSDKSLIYFVINPFSFKIKRLLSGNPSLKDCKKNELLATLNIPKKILSGIWMKA
jgi:hypothetical protein